MNLDIRKHPGKTLTFKSLWLQEQYRKLRLDPELADYTNDELKEYLIKIYDARKLVNGRFENNVNCSNQVWNQEQFINHYLNDPVILTGYACMYQTQEDCVNISAKALETLGALRKVNKKKMEAAEHGSDEYIYYRILQLTYKVLMNSYYGILGEKNSIFYNPYVQNSITKTGQILITTAILSMEAFMTNNVSFEDTDDVITFVNNVKTESLNNNILDYIDEAISKDELFAYFIGHAKNPDTLDKDIIKSIISSLSPEYTSRCYYKNRLLEFLLNNSWCIGKLQNMLKFNYAEVPEEGMVADLEALKEKVMEFCFYDELYEDRYKRAMKDMRETVTTIDTDSVFINANKHIKEISKKLSLDESNDVQQTTIMNIIINIVTEALRRTMWKLTTNMGLLDIAKPIINLKQEFAYKRILLTSNKKNYAGLITAELGHILERPVLDIKGLPILKKTSVPKVLRRQFTEIVENDILKTPVINLKNVLDKYDSIEEQIEKSLRDAKVEYLLPKNLEVIESYKLPETIEAVRGAIIWNAIEPENQIVPPTKLNLLKLDCKDENDPRLLELKKTHPNKYEAIMRVVFNYGITGIPKVDISRFGLACVAIPKGVEEIPDYLIPFIDYKSMTNTNMSASYILLESLGIHITEVNTVQYKSNIIKL